MATVRGGQALITSKVLSNNTEPNIPDNTETTVDTFTATTRDEKLTRILASGLGNGKWNIYIDSVQMWTFNTANGDRSRDFRFEYPHVLSQGSTIDIKVIHYHVSENIDFSSTLEGIT